MRCPYTHQKLRTSTFSPIPFCCTSFRIDSSCCCQCSHSESKWDGLHATLVKLTLFFLIQLKVTCELSVQLKCFLLIN